MRPLDVAARNYGTNRTMSILCICAGFQLGIDADGDHIPIAAARFAQSLAAAETAMNPSHAPGGRGA